MQLAKLLSYIYLQTVRWLILKFPILCKLIPPFVPKIMLLKNNCEKPLRINKHTNLKNIAALDLFAFIVLVHILSLRISYYSLGQIKM